MAADEAGRPSLVLLNEGLAVERDDGFWYLCPRMWGDADTSGGKAPLARSIDGAESWIIGADDLYSARDGVLTAQGRSDMSASKIIALAAESDALFGLHQDVEGSAVVRIDDRTAAPLYTSTDAFSWLAAGDGNLHLARVGEDGEVARLVLDLEGEVIEESLSAVQDSIVQLRLRPTASGLFVVTSDVDQVYRLFAIEQDSWQLVLESPGPIDGPQASADGTLWVAANGELMHDTGDGFTAVGDSRIVTCLEQWGAHAYACAESELYSLDDQGLGQRLFAIDGLHETDPALVPPAGTRDCEFQWVLYRNDLLRVGLTYREFDEGAGGGETSDAAVAPPPAADAGAGDADPQDDPGCDCSAAGAGTKGSPLWLALAAALGVRRLSRARSRAERRG